MTNFIHPHESRKATALVDTIQKVIDENVARAAVRRAFRQAELAAFDMGDPAHAIRQLEGAIRILNEHANRER